MIELTAFFTITRNHNQLQYLTINLQPNPSSLTAEDSPHSRSRSTTVSFSFSFFHNCQLRNPTLLYPLCTDPTENTDYIADKACLLRHCFAINLLLICANVSNDPLPSKGHGADHKENNSWNAFSIVACAYFVFGECIFCFYIQDTQKINIFWFSAPKNPLFTDNHNISN
jgi:hypothetical protein